MVLCPRPHHEGKQCRAIRPKYPAYGLKLSQSASLFGSEFSSLFLVERSGGLLVSVICWCAELECTTPGAIFIWAHIKATMSAFTSLLFVVNSLPSYWL
jgi:hypothetical protein